MGDHFSALMERLKRIFAFAESKRFDGGSASADTNTDGTFDYAAFGPTPKNEEHAFEVCRRLIHHLNEAGANWGIPQEVQADEIPGVDCVSIDLSDPNEQILLQVVRAMVAPSLYKQWGKEKSFHRTDATAKDLADELLTAIRKKREKYEPRDAVSLGDLTLILDATRFPALTFEGVVERFRLDYSQEPSLRSFHAVWIVGPHSRLVHRLDV